MKTFRQNRGTCLSGDLPVFCCFILRYRTDANLMMPVLLSGIYMKLTPNDTKAKTLLSQFAELSKVTKPFGNFNRKKQPWRNLLVLYPGCVQDVFLH